MTLKLKEVKAVVKYGLVLPASDLVLEAKLLKIKQQQMKMNWKK